VFALAQYSSFFHSFRIPLAVYKIMLEVETCGQFEIENEGSGEEINEIVVVVVVVV